MAHKIIPYFESDNSNNIIDFPVQGGFDKQGRLKRVYGAEALSNVMYSWILSKRGDRIRRPERGGSVYIALTKPMDENTLQLLEDALRTDFESEFSPNVLINSLEIIPNFAQKRWEINMEVTSPYLRIKTNFSANLPLV